jgi:hypothetical protein
MQTFVNTDREREAAAQAAAKAAAQAEAEAREQAHNASTAAAATVQEKAPAPVANGVGAAEHEVTPAQAMQTTAPGAQTALGSSTTSQQPEADPTGAVQPPVQANPPSEAQPMTDATASQPTGSQPTAVEQAHAKGVHVPGPEPLTAATQVQSSQQEEVTPALPTPLPSEPPLVVDTQSNSAKQEDDTEQAPSIPHGTVAAAPGDGRAGPTEPGLNQDDATQLQHEVTHHPEEEAAQVGAHTTPAEGELRHYQAAEQASQGAGLFEGLGLNEYTAADTAGQGEQGQGQLVGEHTSEAVADGILEQELSSGPQEVVQLHHDLGSLIEHDTQPHGLQQQASQHSASQRGNASLEGKDSESNGLNLWHSETAPLQEGTAGKEDTLVPVGSAPQQQLDLLDMDFSGLGET